MLSPLFFVVIQVAALAEPSMAEGAFLRGREMKGGHKLKGFWHGQREKLCNLLDTNLQENGLVMCTYLYLILSLPVF